MQMMDMSQIIAAMMANAIPQVTPMGAAPGGGGGGSVSGGGKRGGGINLSMGGRRQQPTVPNFEEVEIAEPYSDPFMQQAGMQQYGDEVPPPPDTTPLEMQLNEAEQMIFEALNPVGLREAWPTVQRDNLKVARERRAQALSNINSFNQEQAFKAQQAEKNRVDILADNTYKTAMQLYGDPDLARRYATAVKRDPESADDIMGNLMTTAESIRGETRDDIQTEQLRQRRYQGYLTPELQMPETVARGFSWNEDMPFQEGVKLWQDAQAAGREQELIDNQAERSRAQAFSTVDNTIKQINNTLDISSGFGATGLLGAMTGWIPESPAYNTLASIDTQKAVNAFEELFQMRQASTTGGALGNVSNREIELLYSAFAALEPGMGDQFTANLADVLQRFERLRYMLQNEKRFDAEGYTAEEMYRESTLATNARVARQMRNENNPNGTPIQALQDVYDDPSLMAEFKQEYGWTPTSLVQGKSDWFDDMGGLPDTRW